MAFLRAHFGLQLPHHRSTREDAIPHVVDFVRRHGRIQNSDHVELFGVSQAHASSVLKDLAGPDSGGLLAPGRTPNLGRDAHYVAGDGFPRTPAGED